jgi:hypothetical protein
LARYVFCCEILVGIYHNNFFTYFSAFLQLPGAPAVMNYLTLDDTATTSNHLVWSLNISVEMNPSLRAAVNSIVWGEETLVTER